MAGAPPAMMTPNAGGTCGAGGTGGSDDMGMSCRQQQLRVEAHLTGQGLDRACAAGMPLPAVAHAKRVVRRFSGDGGATLTEEQFSSLLGRCQISPQEATWLYCALGREGGGGGGSVATGDLLLALMAFYSGEGGGGSGAGGGGGGVEDPAAGGRSGLMVDLRRRYQREVSKRASDRSSGGL